MMESRGGISGTGYNKLATPKILPTTSSSYGAYFKYNHNNENKKFFY
jgi:hypothetical protein